MYRRAWLGNVDLLFVEFGDTDRYYPQRYALKSVICLDVCGYEPLEDRWSDGLVSQSQQIFNFFFLFS